MHINPLELKAVHLVLQEFLPSVQKRDILVWTDSRTPAPTSPAREESAPPFSSKRQWSYGNGRLAILAYCMLSCSRPPQQRSGHHIQSGSPGRRWSSIQSMATDFAFRLSPSPPNSSIPQQREAGGAVGSPGGPRPPLRSTAWGPSPTAGFPSVDDSSGQRSHPLWGGEICSMPILGQPLLI